LSDSNGGISGAIGSLRAGINPAPTKRVDLPVVGAGFTPARIGCWSLQIAHLRKDKKGRPTGQRELANVVL